MFLGKPKDDLRKDARLMDFNAIINKLLKGNSDSRRRQLRKFLSNYFDLPLTPITFNLDIRTYSVVALNEECGFIQWVPNTVPIRPVIVKYYEARRVKSWVYHCFLFLTSPIVDHDYKSGEMAEYFKRVKEMTDQEASVSFREKILSM
jgi:serine/threonine-protein kinase ATR